LSAIYIHIPFCKQRCSYCDFFSSTESRKKEKYIETLCEEIVERKDYLHEPVETIYFGGGTPSLLTSPDFEKIFNTLHLIHGEDRSREITLEANPDDLTPNYVKSIKHLPFNRISLGIQSFNDYELHLLNRRHDAQSATKAVELLQQAGYGNISIDLIYGIPNQNHDIWKETLHQAIDLRIQHISAYHLTYEEGTTIDKQLKEGNLTPVDEEVSNRMFEILIDTLQASGFEQYEISNFARPGFQSRHNSSYWNGTHYLGIGASAHSYNGFSRQWNKKTLLRDYKPTENEIEIIDGKNAYNDFVITRLRTMKGIDLDELTVLLCESRRVYCLHQAQKHIAGGVLKLEDNFLRLTRKGIFVSDGIMSDLLDCFLNQVQDSSQ
jgi:oxygen-independent coproporphyrinogen-3 oxidase